MSPSLDPDLDLDPGSGPSPLPCPIPPHPFSLTLQECAGEPRPGRSLTPRRNSSHPPLTPSMPRRPHLCAAPSTICSGSPPPLQAISVRSAIYDLLRQHHTTSVPLEGMFMADGLHPAWLGHMVWADVMIYTFKQVCGGVRCGM